MFSFPFMSDLKTDSPKIPQSTRMLKGLSLLNRGGGLANTASGIYANRARSRMGVNRFNLEALMDDLEAKQIETNAVAQSNYIKNQLLDNMASATALFANSGKDVASAGVLHDISRNNAMTDILNTQDQGRLGAIKARTSAVSNRANAKITDAFGRFERSGMRYNLIKEGANFLYNARGLIGG